MLRDVNLERSAQRGAHAERLLQDEVIREAFTVVRQSIIDRWAESPIADKEGQHELRLMLKVCDDVKKNIEDVARTGKISADTIQYHKTMAQRAYERTKEIAKGIIR